ncbi:MAG: GNAT family N-acetyltransferase [Thermoanaerobaculia bacterium]|nr:GNAT family N-acetyltransferase [Thermoanaerobaculia bacterium]
MWSGESERYRYARGDDLPAIADMLQDPEVGRWLWFCPISPAGVREYFTPFLDRQQAELAAGATPASAVFVVEDEDGRFLGQGATVEVAGSPGGFEIGYQLCRHAWGRGVGSRLAAFLCAYAVRIGAAHRIEAGCLEGNLGSRRILEGLGLRCEGVRPGYRLKEGARHTECLYGAETTNLDLAAIDGAADALGLRAHRSDGK